MKFRILSLALYFSACLQADSSLAQDNQKIEDYSKRVQIFYELGQEESWRDITEQVLLSPDIPPENKDYIRSYHRRIIVFKYPSEDLWIKGLISFTPTPTYHPLLILYRGGNENFGLLHPGIIFAIYGNYTVVSSTLRGGVSQGSDEFGGSDVNDIKNMMDYLPTLAHELRVQLKPPCVFMLGMSRGGLEMFLTLARFPELQNRINKVVALSSILDLHRQIQDRPFDMKTMFQNHFGLQKGAKGEAWIAQRDPINTIPFLKKSLPILIVQGTADKRINLAEGRHMVQSLKESDHDVNYWEVPGGTHILLNTPHIMNHITQWLESNDACLTIHLPKKNK